MSACYFWKDGEVTTVKKEVMQLYAEKHNLLHFYCVDTFQTGDDKGTYGMFVLNRGWVHLPINTFPKEFRAWLLINL